MSDSPTSSRLPVWLQPAAIFVLGVLTGIGLMPLIAPAPVPVTPALETLNLDSEQRAAVAEIIERYRPAIESTLEPVRPELDALQHEAADEIEALLDDSQRERFQDIRQQRPPLPR